jgi:kynurenine formamidase
MSIDIDNCRIIDLSLPIDENMPFEPFPVKASRLGHKSGIHHLNRTLIFNKNFSMKQKVGFLMGYLFKGRKFGLEDFPDNEFISDEQISCSVHTGTHVDSPFHFGTRCMGQRAKSIEELELKHFMGNGVVLDVTSVKPGAFIKTDDIKRSCKTIGYEFNPGDIVLIRTGASKLWGQKEYFFRFPGMSRDATEYIVDHGIKLIGTDALGFDRPYGVMIDEYFKTGDRGNLWPSHFFGREKEYYHIERLNNLDLIPDVRKFVFCGFPIKILNVGAAWMRAVAIV